MNWAIKHWFSFSSVTQSCPTLCHPMECSIPGFPVHYQKPETTQIQVHWVSDAIQSSHPGGLPSLRSHRVGHDWSDLAAVAGILSAALPQHHFFRIWNNSTGNPSPQLALFVVMLLRPAWLHIPGSLVPGEWSHHCDYLDHEDLFLWFFLLSSI